MTTLRAALLSNQYLTTALFVLFWGGSAICYDALAFEQGAVSTISQVWLALNRRWPWLPYLFPAIVCGMLQQHVSVAENYPQEPRPPFWPFALASLPGYVFGMWLTWMWLWQHPNQDLKR